MKRLCTILLLSLAVCAAAACSPEAQEQKSNKVYTSVYPVYYLTGRIAAKGIPVEIMQPPAADPHNWEPSAKQMAQLEDCSLFIYNGAGLEPWASKVSQMAESNNTAVLDLSSCLGNQLLRGTGHSGDGASGHGEQEDSHNSEYDPHFWLDPVIAQKLAGNIRDALIKVDPDNEELYTRNCSLLIKDLQELDTQYKTTLARCRKKQFVVTHQAFGYLAKRYGLKQVPIMGVSPDSEPTPARLAKLSTQMKSLGIKYVFTEPFSGSQVAQVLAAETGAGVLELNPIGGLTEEQKESGADYLSLMRDNLQQLKVALEYAK